MRKLELKPLILGVTLALLPGNYALAKSQGDAAKEAPVAVSSPDASSSRRPPQTTAESVVGRIAEGTFGRLDADKDGKVSHDEFMAPYEKQFKEVDANSDGLWMKEEYIDCRIKQMGKMRETPHKKP